MSKADITNIVSKALNKIKPVEVEKEKLKVVSDRVIRFVNNTIEVLGIDASAALVGSTARDTWLSGDKDIDIFILLPETMTEEMLEDVGLRIGREVAKKHAERCEEKYAEHPYVHAWFDGYEVDIVPCFKVPSAEKIKSPVDRTPFHTEYMRKKIAGLEDEVLLLKQFMLASGAYGAELKVQGFSGYLCELLILHYRSFMNFLKSASEWKFGERIDIEGHGKYKGKDPLVVIDPVDANRNAAAALSLDNFCRVADASRAFLASPKMVSFFPKKGKPIKKAELRQLIESRGTELLAVIFDVPAGIVDDIVFPQLRKAQKSVTELLHRNDFRVYRSDVFRKNGSGILLLEMEVAHLPEIKKHFGPPITSKEHTEKFRKKYGRRIKYIEDGRFVAEVQRKHVHAKYLLSNEIKSCGLGKNLSEYRYRILTEDKIPTDKELGIFLREYFEK